MYDRRRNYMFECWYESDKDKFLALLKEKEAILYKILVVGDAFRQSYLIIYAHTEELQMEVLC